MIGWIFEGIGLLYCLFCILRDRPRGLLNAGISLGKRIRWIPLFKRKTKDGSIERCLFPQESEKERALKYRNLRLGVLIAALVSTGAVLLLAEGMNQPAPFLGLQLARPRYGEPDGSVEYKVEAEQDGQRTSRDLRIEIPSQDPSKEQAEALFAEAEKQLRDFAETLEFTDTGFTLPESVGPVDLRFTSERPEIADSSGEVDWTQVREETAVPYDVRMSLNEYTSEFTLEIIISPKVRSFTEEVEETLRGIQEGSCLGETELQLPTEDENGITYRWSAQDAACSPGILLLWLVLLPFLVLYVFEQRYKNQIQKRNQQILQRYPDMLNKLMILMGAGLSLTKAWERIVQDYRLQKEKYRICEPLYEEMDQVGQQLHNGYSMEEAIQLLSERTQIQEIRRFCSMLQMGWRRGDSHILTHLGELYEQVWERHKQSVKKLSEQADTKLLFPLMLMLGVVMIIVLAPAMMTMHI